MSQEPLFWCVWSEGGGSPTVKHAEFPRAKAEAQRLARQHPGKRFVVLAAALAYVKNDLAATRFHQCDWQCDCDIPF
jgi:hypothetical protein